MLSIKIFDKILLILLIEIYKYNIIIINRDIILVKAFKRKNR